ncbi:HNH endonuclease [Aquibacillus koreensis]|uniref:HNH endonuclease n=1 Tax=Aquibacillus koreensis TaxID=279446 RepID=A0A9X4AJI0_9BACI|nr:HNH endonuclease [Aquibacillus koreensis]MCT2535974.1 HNH endonuclease [Aquibacillus koreensis]MDC3420430.1 HNH endonuclease [Aquibacillus koreensis]
MVKDRGVCELCDRENVALTKHHLTPKEEGGTFKATAMLCIPCHKQIHALYTNTELALRLSTIPLLKDDEKIAKYIKWIRKQAPTDIVRVKKSRERRGR